MSADLYDVLGTSNDAAAEEIKRAYRERVREYHPDVNDHPEGDAQFKLIRTAKDVLSDPAERKDYDRLGHREYVSKHFEDLPPVSVFPDEDLPDGVTTADEPSAGSSSVESTDGDSSTKTADRGASRARTGDGSQRNRSAENGRSRGESSTDTGGSSRGAANEPGYGGMSESSENASTTAESSSVGTDTSQGTTNAGAERSSWDAATNSTRSTGESTVPAGVRRRRGLKRWYGVVALSLLVYAAGLALYALPRQSALREFVADVTTAPTGTLLGTFPFISPTEYLLGAVRAATAGTAEVGLVLLAGTVLLPLVVLTTIGRFGRGAAWMYAVPSLSPAIWIAAWPAVAMPMWLALLGLIVLPVLSAGGFLVDVGRYLRATR